MRARLPLTTLLNALAVPALCVVGGVWFLADPHAAKVSEVENRALATFPVFTRQALASGQYTRDIELYVADHFPLRERLVEVASWVKAHRGPARATAEYDASARPRAGGARASSAHEGGGAGLEDLDAWVADDAGPVDGALDRGGAGVVDGGPPEGGFVSSVDTSQYAPPEAKVKDGVLVTGGRAMAFFAGTEQQGRDYADVVNLYARALAEREETAHVRLHNVVTPTAGEYYWPTADRKRTRSERAHLEAMADHLDASVVNADVADALLLHADEAIFYKTDHHWTGLGAYYGYHAWAEAAGLWPVAKETLEQKTRPAASGSLYRMTQDPRLLKSARDDVTDYWVPRVRYKATITKTTDLKESVRGSLLMERERGYLVFLGFDHPLIVADVEVPEGSLSEGRRALLVKNSFGNAFAPWLLNHFEKVVIVDYRYYAGSVLGLVKKHDITDVVLVGAVSTTASRAHHRRLKSVLKGSGTAWEQTERPGAADAGPKETP